MKNKKIANLLALAALCGVLTSCGSSPGGGGKTPEETETKLGPWKTVSKVTNKVTGKREVMKTTVNGREIVAVLRWRDYSAKLDAGVGKWYGDMASPPPKYVVESLMVSMDGRGMLIPKSKVRYLASQWMNESSSLGLNQRGNQLRLLVDVGDGAEGWTATYVIAPSTLTLVSHAVEDGPTVHNAIQE